MLFHDPWVYSGDWRGGPQGSRRALLSDYKQGSETARGRREGYILHEIYRLCNRKKTQIIDKRWIDERKGTFFIILFSRSISSTGHRRVSTGTVGWENPLHSTFATCYPLFLGCRLPDTDAIMEVFYLISKQCVAIKATEILPNIGSRYSRLWVGIAPEMISRSRIRRMNRATRSLCLLVRHVTRVNRK